MRRARTLTAGRKANATTHRLKRRRTNGKTRHIPCRESSVAGSPLLPVNTPHLASPACRRDSACCNFCPSGHEIWQRCALAARCVSVLTAPGPSLVSVARVLCGAFCSRFPSFCVCSRSGPSSLAVALSSTARALGLVCDRDSAGTGGCTAADAAREGAYDRCLGLMSAWSF